MNPISNQELLFHSHPNFPGLAHLNSDNHPSGTQNNLARKRRQPRSGFLWFLSTLWAHGHLLGRATRICLCGPVRQHQPSRPVCDSVQELRWCLILWVLKRHLQRPQRSPSLHWQSKRGLGHDGEYFLAKQILCLSHHQLVWGALSQNRMTSEVEVEMAFTQSLGHWQVVPIINKHTPTCKEGSVHAGLSKQLPWKPASLTLEFSLAPWSFSGWWSPVERHCACPYGTFQMGPLWWKQIKEGRVT